MAYVYAQVCRVCATVFSTGSNFRLVSNFTELHAPIYPPVLVRFCSDPLEVIELLTTSRLETVASMECCLIPTETTAYVYTPPYIKPFVSRNSEEENALLYQ